VSAAMTGGCSSSDAGNDTPTTALVDELAAHDGQPCPPRLPLGDDPGGHGFGVEDPADEKPNLNPGQVAWLCRYETVDLPPDENGANFTWELIGQAVRVPNKDLPMINQALTAITPAPTDQICTDDLGPRWMIVTADETDLTGVVIDDYGCRGVRLTDEPFASPPGEASGNGMVPGVLQGPTELLDTIRRIMHYP